MCCKTYWLQKNSQLPSTLSPSRKNCWPRAQLEIQHHILNLNSSLLLSGAVTFTAQGRRKKPWPGERCSSGRCRKNREIRSECRQNCNATFIYDASRRWSQHRQLTNRSERRQPNLGPLLGLFHIKHVLLTLSVEDFGAFINDFTQLGEGCSHFCATLYKGLSKIVI